MTHPPLSAHVRERLERLDALQRRLEWSLHTRRSDLDETKRDLPKWERFGR